MFEQHERWLEYTNRKESVTCSSGHMPLTAIADFAATLERQALTTTIWAIVTSQQADAHATSRRDEFRQRIQKLRQGGDLVEPVQAYTVDPESSSAGHAAMRIRLDSRLFGVIVHPDGGSANIRHFK
jgi:hypothetical protein